MSVASISPSSRSCWSRRSRCGRRGARSMPGSPRSPTRSRCMRRRRRPITFDWPDAVRVDGGLVGGGRLAWPPGADEDEPPAWLVFGAMIRTVAMGEEEPGLRPLSSALEEEGFDDLGSGRAGGELRAPSHGRDRRLAGEGIWRGRQELSRAACARERACAATSTTTAISWCGAWARSRPSAARSCARSPRRRGSIPRPEARGGEALLRTIRLDPSDTFVFERAAEPGEWAVSGAFMFADADPDALDRQAARRLPRRISRRALARLVDAGADRRGERSGSRRAVETLAQAAARAISARPISPRRARPRRRRSRSRPRSAIIRATR